MHQTDDDFYSTSSKLKDNLTFSLRRRNIRRYKLPARQRAQFGENESTFLDSDYDMGGINDNEEDIIVNGIDVNNEEDIVVSGGDDVSDNTLMHDDFEEEDLLNIELELKVIDNSASAFSYEIDDKNSDDDDLITSIERPTCPVQKPEYPILGLDSVQIEVRGSDSKCLRTHDLFPHSYHRRY